MWVPDPFYPPERLIAPLAQLQQQIDLAPSGSLLVSEGARVEAGELVAERETEGTLHVLDATRVGIAPEEVERRLWAAVGEKVEAGQPLVKRGRFSRPTLPAPVGGTLLRVDARKGFLLLRAAPARHPVNALLGGTLAPVEGKENQRQIEGSGALLQGAWGHGGSAMGLLRLISQDASATPPHGLLNAGLRGTLLVAGQISDAGLLRRLEEIGILGLILGSLDASLLPLTRQLSFPILLTEGFGAMPISAPIFSLLQGVDGKQATLMGHGEEAHSLVAVGYGALAAPLLLVPQTGPAAPLAPPGPLVTGARVRLLVGPHQGETGTVEALRGRRLVLPNGLTAASCLVRLDGGERILLPYPNLERLLP